MHHAAPALPHLELHGFRVHAPLELYAQLAHVKHLERGWVRARGRDVHAILAELDALRGRVEAKVLQQVDAPPERLVGLVERFPLVLTDELWQRRARAQVVHRHAIRDGRLHGSVSPCGNHGNSRQQVHNSTRDRVWSMQTMSKQQQRSWLCERTTRSPYDRAQQAPPIVTRHTQPTPAATRAAAPPRHGFTNVSNTFQ
jgi:hypothetical protein